MQSQGFFHLCPLLLSQKFAPIPCVGPIAIRGVLAGCAALCRVATGAIFAGLGRGWGSLKEESTMDCRGKFKEIASESNDPSAHGSKLGTKSPKLLLRNRLNETELRDVGVSKMF